MAAHVEDAEDLVLDGDARSSTPRMDRTERRLAERVRDLVDAPPTLDVDVPAEPPEDGDAPPTATSGARCTPVAEHRLAILTGLPGTGKTATMRALVDLLLRAEADRAAVRADRQGGAAAERGHGGAEATTIHRLLEYVPGEGFARDADDPLTGVDLLVVDEASMLDVRLAEALLGAVGPRTHVLLVGDVDQLAPVGPGRVLEDLIASGHRALDQVGGDLPPGRALADRPRRARDRPRRAAADRRPARTTSATSS